MNTKKSKLEDEFKKSKQESDKDWFKQKMEFEELECQFGLMLREKNDHDNYVMLNFSDLEDIVNYFEIFKRMIR